MLHGRVFVMDSEIKDCHNKVIISYLQGGNKDNACDNTVYWFYGP